MTTRALRADVREAQWLQDRGPVEGLFRDYVAALGVDISFQSVDEKLRGALG